MRRWDKTPSTLAVLFAEIPPSSSLLLQRILCLLLASSFSGVLCLVLCAVCAYLLSHVRLFATPWTVAHQAPLSMGILQARTLEWVAMPSSRTSSQPRDRTQVSRTGGDCSLLSEPPGKPSFSHTCICVSEESH